jgi:WhiB family redox-sensing transcriptional regulator
MPKSAVAQDWSNDAACKPHRIPEDKNPDWFAVRDKWSRVSEAPRGEADAEAICRTCPVQKDCLEFALTQPGLEGIWGGKTESQRRSLRRHRQRIAAAERNGILIQ